MQIFYFFSVQLSVYETEKYYLWDGQASFSSCQQNLHRRFLLDRGYSRNYLLKVSQSEKEPENQRGWEANFLSHYNISAFKFNGFARNTNRTWVSVTHIALTRPFPSFFYPNYMKIRLLFSILLGLLAGVQSHLCSDRCSGGLRPFYTPPKSLYTPEPRLAFTI